MKKSGMVLGLIVFVTLIFYLLTYYLLPPPPPSAAMMVLFAAAASALVWALMAIAHKMVPKEKRPERPRKVARSIQKKNIHTLLLLSSAGCLALGLCSAARAEAVIATCKFITGPRAGGGMYYFAPATAKLGDLCADEAGSSGTIVAIQVGSVPIERGKTSSAPAKAAAAPSAPAYEDSAPATAAPSQSAPSASESSAPMTEMKPSPPPAKAAPPPPPTGGGLSGGGGGGGLSGITTGGRGLASLPSTSAMPRVTGTATLLPGEKEESGYGLYSYALLSHAPQQSELPRYRSFLTALLELPAAKDVQKYVPKRRINITYLPMTSASPEWGDLNTDERVDYVLAHYDYARGAAILASLPGSKGPGPLITSVLTPVTFDAPPHPVLVQDLSRAQPLLMADYVKQFVDQAAQDHFWEARTLAAFSLSLRNALETAAIGFGLSQDAVQKWVRYLK